VINPNKQKRLDEEDRALQGEREDQHTSIDAGRASSKKKTKVIITSILIGLIIIIGLPLTIRAMTPGKWDGFAQCLTEKGVVMQGEDWCQYTNAQKGMFGKSFKYVTYQIKEDLVYRPTWIIDGKKYEKVQSFERLRDLTGCDFQK
jgi:hypothetical protein|tara:strand:+ start:341 stop:778 length:438 start_codon:yes stop_codon:yes gene_type:complete